jgi:hypothetical protein
LLLANLPSNATLPCSSNAKAAPVVSHAMAAIDLNRELAEAGGLKTFGTSVADAAPPPKIRPRPIPFR